jgi:hypothetical protein
VCFVAYPAGASSCSPRYLRTPSGEPHDRTAQKLPVPAKARIASILTRRSGLKSPFALRNSLRIVSYNPLAASMSASPKDRLSRNASPAPRQGVNPSPLLLPIRAGSLSQEEPRRSSTIQFLAHRNSSLPRGSPKPRQKRRLSSPPPPP